MFTYFRAISLFILLSASVTWGAVSEIDGPSDIFGGGGVSEGSDVGFANLTAYRIKAVTGKFNNISSTNIYNSGNVTSNFVYGTSQVITGAVNSVGNNNDLTINVGKIYSTDGLSPVRINGTHSGTSGETYAIKVDPTLNQGGTAGFSAVFIDITSITVGSGDRSFIKSGYDNATKYRLDYEGTSYNAGGQYIAFRNLSSATETLTSADHTVFCLANDNEVVATMPPCSGQSYSQQLIVIYTDSGSTNKCKLDGNGAETVASFDVFSGLDTFEEGCHFTCDGSGNWWRAGCF